MARTPLAGAVQDAVASVAGERRTTRTLRQEAGAAARPDRARTARGAGARGGCAEDRRRRGRPRRAQRRVPAPRRGPDGGDPRGERPDRRPLLDAPRRLRRRQIAEHGGELIDQGHSHIRQLAQRLGLKLDNLLQAEQNGTELLGYFDGSPYTYEEMTDDIKAAWQKIHADVSAASYPTTFEISTERGRQLDNMSIVDWIEETFEGGIDSRIPGARRRLHHRVRRRVRGAERAQPALPARLLGPGPVPRLRAVEREVPRRRRQRPDHGPARRAARGPDHDRLRARRRAPRPAGTFTLTFAQQSGTKTVTADKVVLALPFSILRSSVDLSKAGFEP